MPRYLYRCVSCSGEVEVWHSMSNRLEDCIECEAKGSLIRVPTSFRTAETDQKTGKKVGELVKSSIEDFKKDLNEEKKKIKEEIYKI